MGPDRLVRPGTRKRNYERIKNALSVQRGNARLSNLQVLNVAEHGRQSRGFPKRFSGLHAIYAEESLVEEQAFWTGGSRSYGPNRSFTSRSKLLLSTKRGPLCR